MGLNVSKGNMYDWVNFTWNVCKGACPHDCKYCYVKRWGKLNPIRFDEKEFKEFDRDMKRFGEGQTIFVGSSCDMWAEDIPSEWIIKILEHCAKYRNTYLFQTKNPQAFHGYSSHITQLYDFALCTTIETNRFYSEFMGNTPPPIDRVYEIGAIPWDKKYVTIEPIMDFDLEHMVNFIIMCDEVKQVNIGADTGNNNLPEPHGYKIKELIKELELFTIVKQKSNLKRLLK